MFLYETQQKLRFAKTNAKVMKLIIVEYIDVILNWSTLVVSKFPSFIFIADFTYITNKETNKQFNMRDRRQPLRISHRS